MFLTAAKVPGEPDFVVDVWSWTCDQNEAFYIELNWIHYKFIIQICYNIFLGISNIGKVQGRMKHQLKITYVFLIS